MKIKMQQGLSIFRQVRDAKPTKVGGQSPGNREPAVVSSRARKAIPKRSPQAKAPGGRSLTQSETDELSGQMAVAFVREFFPQQLTNRRLMRPAAF
jgi:hypothetical protein